MFKILFAEDGLIVAFHLKNILEMNGYEVVSHLTHGEEVFDTFKATNPDLLILDIMLEGYMTGIEAAKMVRETSEVPIIFISALTDENTINEISAMSNTIKHDKPFNEDLLLKEITLLLSAK